MVSRCVFEGPKKKSSHLALNDVKENIAELQYYRRNIFVESYSEYVRNICCFMFITTLDTITFHENLLASEMTA